MCRFRDCHRCRMRWGWEVDRRSRREILVLSVASSGRKCEWFSDSCYLGFVDPGQCTITVENCVSVLLYR